MPMLLTMYSEGEKQTGLKICHPGPSNLYLYIGFLKHSTAIILQVCFMLFAKPHNTLVKTTNTPMYTDLCQRVHEGFDLQ